MAQATPSPSAASGSAMQRAVVAEADARQAIVAAEAAAVAAVEQARGQARAILDAVPGRIERLRQRGANAVEHALAGIEAESTEALAALGQTALPDELLEPATAALAARLTGGEGEGPR